MRSLLVLSDLHCGNLKGLTPPDFQRPVYAYFQRPFWDWYVATLEQIGRVDAMVVLGDAIDGLPGHDHLDVGEANVAAQAHMAAGCLRLVQTRKRYLVRGTPRHVTGEAEFEDLIAAELHCEGVRDEWALDLAGTRLHARHVQGRSDTAYCQGTQVYKEMARELLQSIEQGYEPASVTMRGHVHYSARMEIGDRMALSFGCLELPETVFGRTCRSFYYHVGLSVLRGCRGQLPTVEKHLMPLRVVRQREYVRI